MICSWIKLQSKLVLRSLKTLILVVMVFGFFWNKKLHAENLPVGKFFLVEQASVETRNEILKSTKNNAPGGIVFWNASKADAAQLQASIREYSEIAQKLGDDPWLFSIDYEGGALSETPKGRKVPGVQRFIKGFTPLAHPVWLGLSMRRFNTELCELHGTIMGKELAAVGVNYPLTVVSDLAYGLFSYRGVATNPIVVAQCLQAFLFGITHSESVIAVTKHFPGLGQTEGDTHDGVSVSKAKNLEDLSRDVSAFSQLIEFANKNNLEKRLSILSSHGLYPLLDSVHLATESPKILTALLVEKLDFRGIRVSDAMWMGDYGKLSGAELNAVYINAFLAGTDLLMIPGSKYRSAVKAFDQMARGQVENSLRQSLELRTHRSLENLREQFLKRAKETLTRLHETTQSLKHASDVQVQRGVQPRDLTNSERERYGEILSQLGYGRSSGTLP